jgi:hypothetical protein
MQSISELPEVAELDTEIANPELQIDALLSLSDLFLILKSSLKIKFISELPEELDTEIPNPEQPEIAIDAILSLSDLFLISRITSLKINRVAIIWIPESL